MLGAVSFVNEYIFGIGVPILLILLGLFYCVRLKLFHFLHPIRVLKCIFSGKSSSGVSSARAVTLALAGTLGVGNMVGVASAIALGGFGAVFWMWVSALVAMVLKYAEIVLAMRYRKFDENGRPYGAAMHYIKACFKNGRLGVVLALVFAFFCVFNSISMGSMIQMNAAASAMEGVLGLPPLAVGAVIALVAFFALKRGSKGIISFTEKLVPAMTVGFVVLSVAVICARPSAAGRAFALIFEDAFKLRSGACGVLGFFLSGGLRYGTMRGILSNEAGCGTAPAAHAVADCDIPAKQGVWGIFEVFVDTILLCTLTAIVIIIGYDGALAESGNYMMMTISAYGSVLGRFAEYFISVCVLFFGLATVLCWGYYGMESVKYLCRKSWARSAFILVYAASIVIGSVLSGEIIWETADLALGVMSFINLSVLFLMNTEVKRETELYFGSK